MTHLEWNTDPRSPKRQQRHEAGGSFFLFRTDWHEPGCFLQNFESAGLGAPRQEHWQAACAPEAFFESGPAAAKALGWCGMLRVKTQLRHHASHAKAKLSGPQRGGKTMDSKLPRAELQDPLHQVFKSNFILISLKPDNSLQCGLSELSPFQVLSRRAPASICKLCRHHDIRCPKIQTPTLRTHAQRTACTKPM